MTPHIIPDAWPILLTIDQVRAYLGGMDVRTLRKVLPVQPVDMGANVLRYSRPEVDAWVASLGPRLPKALTASNDSHEPHTPDDTDIGKTSFDLAMERASKRAAGGRRHGRNTI